MLRNASNGNTYDGAILEDMVVLDQKGIVRLYSHAAATQLHAQVVQMVNALLEKAPVISFFPQQFYFGRTVQLGKTQSVQLAIENTGVSDFEITGIDAPPGISIDPQTLVVHPQEKKTIQLTWMPEQVGAFSGAVTLQNNSSFVGPLEIPILPVTVEKPLLPNLQLPRDLLDFGSVEVGRTKPQTLWIDNSGAGPLTISKIATDSNQWTVISSQFTVQPGDSVAVAVSFTPRSEGVLTGTLSIDSDDPSFPVKEIPVSGQAVIILADSKIDFDGSGRVDFPDFLAFVGSFGTQDIRYDLNNDGTVDFQDFLIFADAFGRPSR